MLHRKRDERDLLIPAFGVHDRSSVPAAEVIANLQDKGWPVYVIEGAPSSKAEFFEAVKATLPTDPPLGPRPNWDAMSDSMWNGLHALHAEQVAIVWPDATEMAQHDPEGYRVAREIFNETVFGLADPKFGGEHVTRLLVLLG